MLRLHLSALGALLLSGLVAPVARADEGPPTVLNARVLDFARNQVGRLIGDGQCTELVYAAYQYAGARLGGGDSGWGHRIWSLNDARPGDVLQLEGAVFKGRKTFPNGGYRTWEYRYPHHTAIVESVAPGADGLVVTVLHQNVSSLGGNGNESKPVRRDSLNMAELQPGGHVFAFRPLSR